MSASRRPTRAAVVIAAAAAGLAAAACTPGAYHATVDPQPGVTPRRGATAPEAVREIPAPAFGPGWQERVAAAVGAPYEVLATVDATSAGPRAAELGRERVRRETARLGGNAMVLVDVRRANVGPYTTSRGYALRVLPPMPDAAARCARVLAPADAGTRLVACREAARQDPSRAEAWAGMAAAHLALAAPAAGRQVDRAFAEASLAMARAARADRRYAAAEPWLDAARPAFGGDSLRTALVVGRRLGDAGLVDAAVAAARAAVRAGPASVDAVTLASDLLRDAGRPREALAVAADYVRREPGRAAGWVLAGMAAARAGDDTLAARAFARVEAIEPRYFSRLRVVAPKGADEAAAARARAGRQPPATVEQLAAAGP